MDCIVPLRGIPNNSTTYRLPIDDQNISLTLRLTYNEIAGYWMMDLTNEDGQMLVSGLPVIPAQNILEQYRYMQIGSAYVLPKSKVEDQWPGYESLTSDWYLVWSDTYDDG